MLSSECSFTATLKQIQYLKSLCTAYKSILGKFRRIDFHECSLLFFPHFHLASITLFGVAWHRQLAKAPKSIVKSRPITGKFAGAIK